MDEWEKASPPAPKQFMQMIAESGLFSPIQMKYIQALMKNPMAAAPAAPAGAGMPPGGAAAPVSPANAGTGTPESSALGPASPVPSGLK